MANINQLETVHLRELIDQTKNIQKENKVEEGDHKDFGETITDFVKAVNDAQKDSSKAISDIIEGKSQNLHQAMAKAEEAKLSFQLMLEIRNKLVDAYKEVQRMQV